MKTSSAKAKGRRAASELRDLFLKSYPDINPLDLLITLSGDTGPDLKLLGEWAKLNFAIECKNQEALQIWAAIKQAQSHVVGDQIPILAFKRNKSELMVCLKAADFFKLIT